MNFTSLLLVCLLQVDMQVCQEPHDPPSCSGEPQSAMAQSTLAICDLETWASCEKEETWTYDECGNVVDYSCRIIDGGCGTSCELTCPN